MGQRQSPRAVSLQRHAMDWLGARTSSIPGMRAVKRGVQDHAMACGISYWMSSRASSTEYTMLVYHRVVEQPDPFYSYATSLNVFEAQLAMLKRFCAVVALDEVIERLEAGRPLPKRCVVLTFDDGFRDTYTLAWPLLKRHGLPATLFVAVQALDEGVLWPDLLRAMIRQTTAQRVVLNTLNDMVVDLADLPQRVAAVSQLGEHLKAVSNVLKERALDELVAKLLDCSRQEVSVPGLMLSWNEVCILAEEGMTIGSHSLTHPILSRLSLPEAEHEIRGSRQRLEEHLSRPVQHFAYPNGQLADFSEGIREIVRSAGYHSACTTVYGMNSRTHDRYMLRRISGGLMSVRALARVMVEATHLNHGNGTT